VLVLLKQHSTLKLLDPGIVVEHADDVAAALDFLAHALQQVGAPGPSPVHDWGLLLSQRALNRCSRSSYSMTYFLGDTLPIRPKTTMEAHKRTDTMSKFQNKFLRLPQVKATTGLSKSTIYARIAEGTFPKQIAIGPRLVVWVESDIQNWISDQVSAARG